MYIDTHTKESMEASICNLLNMNSLELHEQLMLLDKSSKDEDDFSNNLDLFIVEKVTTYPDEILLFHLARRLHGAEDEIEGRNLADLLLSENQFSKFMKENGVAFSKGDQHIDVTYKGKIVDWDRCWSGNAGYMKLRLGYYKGREDFCFNGFLLVTGPSSCKSVSTPCCTVAKAVSSPPGCSSSSMMSSPCRSASAAATAQVPEAQELSHTSVSVSRT